MSGKVVVIALEVYTKRFMEGWREDAVRMLWVELTVGVMTSLGLVESDKSEAIWATPATPTTQQC